MPKLEDYAIKLGGALGGITTYLLTVNIYHVFEIAVYAAVGAGVSEVVKEAVKAIKAFKKKKNEQGENN